MKSGKDNHHEDGFNTLSNHHKEISNEFNEMLDELLEPFEFMVYGYRVVAIGLGLMALFMYFGSGYLSSCISALGGYLEQFQRYIHG